MSDLVLPDVSDIHSIVSLSIAKGLAFTLVTTLLLFVALRDLPPDAGSLATASEAGPLLGDGRSLRSYAFALTITLATLAIRIHLPAQFSHRPMMILLMLPIIFLSCEGPSIERT